MSQSPPPPPGRGGPAPTPPRTADRGVQTERGTWIPAAATAAAGAPERTVEVAEAEAEKFPADTELSGAKLAQVTAGAARASEAEEGTREEGSAAARS